MTALTLFGSFFKVGLFGWGGGAALYPLIEAECSSHGYLGGDAERLAELFAITNAIPGVTAVKMAAYIGWEEGGIAGAAAATAGVCLPGVTLLFVLFSSLMALRNNAEAHPTMNRVVSGLINGLQFGAVGFVAYSAWRILPGDVSQNSLIAGVVLSMAVIAALSLKAPPIPVILGCGILGILFFR